MFRFHVPQMACGGCVRGGTAAVQRVDPQARIEPDLPTRQVTVSVSTAAKDPVPLLDALRKAGYAAELRS